MIVCSICRLAPVSPRERHCIYCGNATRGLEVRFDPPELTVVPNGGPDVEEVTVRVHNTGQFGTRVLLLPFDLPWLEAPGPRAEPTVLAVGGDTSFRVRVRTREGLLAGGRAQARVGAEEGSPGEVRDYSAVLNLFPAPSVVADLAPESEVLMDVDPGPDLRARVVVRSDPQTRVTRVVPVPAWAKVVGTTQGDGRISIRVRAADLRQAHPLERPDVVALPLTVYTESPVAKVEAQLSVPVRWPPRLDWRADGAEERDGSFVYRVTPGRVRDFLLTFRNTGGRLATLTGVELEGEGAALLCPLGRWPSEEAPLELAPGKQHFLAVAVDLRGPARPLPLKVKVRPITASDTDVPEATVRIEDAGLPIFEGAVALDFGTSYSCLAAWRPNRKYPDTAMLLGGARSLHVVRTKTPESQLASSIVYTYFGDDGLRLGEVGHDRLQGSTSLDATARQRPVFSAKRWIGTRHQLRASFTRDAQDRLLPADDVCTDIIGGLLDDAESVLGARIRRCALSHPVRFSPRQLAALRRALTDAGVEVGRMLPEPVAAALAYAVRNPPGDAMRDGYTLLVFDVGGGTTDLATFRIVDRKEGLHSRVLVPHLLSVGGLRWAGGDDITWLVLRKMLHEPTDAWIEGTDALAEAVQRQLKDLEPVRPLADDLDALRGSTLEETAKAFTLAESYKRSPQDSGKLLSGSDDMDPLVDTFLDGFDVLRTAQETLAKAKIGHPDRILMVGSSWQMEALERRVKAEFPNSEFVTLNDGQRRLKEVVAMGLCHAEEAATYMTGLELDLSQIPVYSTARVGYTGMSVDTGAAEFREILPASEPVGTFAEANGLLLSRERRIRILENTGPANDLEREKDGLRSRNPEIDVIGTVLLDEHLPKEMDETTLRRDGKLEVQMTEEHEVVLRVSVVGREPVLVRLGRPDDA